MAIYWMQGVIPLLLVLLLLLLSNLCYMFTLLFIAWIAEMFRKHLLLIIQNSELETASNNGNMTSFVLVYLLFRVWFKPIKVKKYSLLPFILTSRKRREKKIEYFIIVYFRKWEYDIFLKDMRIIAPLAYLFNIVHKGKQRKFPFINSSFQ